MPPAVEPVANLREQDLARWVHGDTPEGARLAAHLARYREELLRPFEEMGQDYTTLGDMRVSEDLRRLLVTARGHT